jgi:nucleoside-diphosphate-sugar epimerase
MTSALEACWPPTTSPDCVSDETRWTDTSEPGLSPYRLSKAIAERTAWDFMASQSGPTTLTTILPSAVFGPVFTSEKLGSVQLISRLLDGKLPAIPRIGFCVADARDVADLHIRAMIAPQAVGQRFIAAGQWMRWAEVAGVLRSALADGAQKVPTREMPDFLLRIAAQFDRPMQFFTPGLGRKHDFTAAKAQALLGWKTRPAAETIVDCARSLIATGAV